VCDTELRGQVVREQRQGSHKGLAGKLVWQADLRVGSEEGGEDQV
jgi:hypothetical protein